MNKEIENAWALAQRLINNPLLANEVASYLPPDFEFGGGIPDYTSLREQVDELETKCESAEEEATDAEEKLEDIQSEVQKFQIVMEEYEDEVRDMPCSVRKFVEVVDDLTT